MSAQDAEEGTTALRNLQEHGPSAEPAPEEPALQLNLDSAGVGVVPSPPRTADGYTLEKMWPKPWLELELDSYGLKMKRTGPTIGGADYILVATPPREPPFSAGLAPSQEELDRKKRRRRLGLGIGLGVGLPLVGFGIGAGVWAANFSVGEF